MAKEFTPGQAQRLTDIARIGCLEHFWLHKDIPAGSLVALAYTEHNTVRWIEVVEPEPTSLWAYDTGAS